MSKSNKIDLYTLVLYRLRYWVFIILIITIWMVKSCIEPDIDPLDDSINTSREYFETIIVADSARNGFELVYATTHAVTKERLAEIKARKHIYTAFDRLKTDAPVHFGSMLNTDIFDFTEFALKYNSDNDIYLANVFVYGKQKQELYIGDNPKIENSATWLNRNTQQGIQYITAKEISYCLYQQKKYYRYWKCNSIHGMSYTDERYSHFSEEERLW